MKELSYPFDIDYLLKNKDELNPYLQPTYPKVVVVDAFHQFWGRCEVAEIMLKKFQEEPANANKVDWVSIPFNQISDIVPREKDESGKYKEIGAKPNIPLPPLMLTAH